MIDFTSALYLGMHHGWRSLSPWASLTTGRPAALSETAPARAVARALAKLQGCEAAVLVTSTLHAFWDLGGSIGRDVELLADAELYAVGRAAVERARGRGTPVRRVPHYDGDAWRRAANDTARKGRRPVLVCDGLCPDCGRVAPLGRVTPLFEAHGGRVIVDDTQGLGVVGEAPSDRRPWGVGGGGVPRHEGVASSDTMIVTSLAKAFGVPVAAVSGSRSAIRRYALHSETRAHSSPPSYAHVAAAARALRLNRVAGERLRARLFDNVRRFRGRAAGAGVSLTRTPFPVQTVDAVVDGPSLHRVLLQRGVATVLRAAGRSARPRTTFVVTASHTPAEIEEAVRHLALAIAQCTRTPTEDIDDVDHERWIRPVAAAFSDSSRRTPGVAAR